MEANDDIVYENIDKERDKNTEWDFFSINNNTSKFWSNECTSIDYSVKASTLNEYGAKGSEIIFSVTTTGWLDPSSLHLSFTIFNGSDYYCQLDGSAHSLFSEFYVTINGMKVESYKEYGKIHKFISDLRMSKNERIERSNEGFGTNKDGDDEYIIAPSTVQLYDKKDIKHQNDEFVTINKDGDDNDKKGDDMIIKVESCIFGNKIDKKNWKIIPLDQLDIKFVYKLSPNFGFIPRRIKLRTPADEDAYVKLCNFRKINDGIYPFRSNVLETDIKYEFQQEVGGKLSNMKIIKPMLKFKKYIFSDEWNSRLISDYSRVPMVFEMNSFDILVTKWIDTKPTSLLMSIMLNKTEERVRAIYGVAYLINENDNQRIFGRINPGFSKMQLQTENTYWPYDAYFDKTEVYNINTQKSIKPVLYKLLRFNNISDIVFRSRVKKNYEDDFYTINKENMSRLIDISFVKDSEFKEYLSKYEESYISLPEQEKKAKTAQHLKINDGVCKWLNVLSFDTVPYSNDKVIGGIRIQGGNAINILFKKSIESITSSNKFPPYYTNVSAYNMHLIMESNQILRMDINGNTEIL